MLATNPRLESWPSTAPLLDSVAHELSHTCRIQGLKRVIRQQPTLYVTREETACIIAAHA